jgi:manganese/iron transport system permease protein
MDFWATYGMIILAAVLGGGAAGLLGVFLVGLRMPFITVFSAHSAMAGAVYGTFIGLSPSVAGFIGALLGGLFLARLVEKTNVEANSALAVLFSLTMGLAFLGIGLSPGPKSEMLSLIWGSLLFVTRGQVWFMLALAVLLVGFVFFLNKELKALVFSRELAQALFPTSLVFTSLLVLSAGVIAVNLEIVGGLMLFSLVNNPATAALRVARSYRAALVISTVGGALSALVGFFAAYGLNLPVGACIVLVSSAFVGAAFLYDRVKLNTALGERAK